MSKFTKGPWKAEKNCSYIEITSVFGNIGDVCMSGHQFDNSDCLNGIVCNANANLIAAAPEMYELLDALNKRGGLGLPVHKEIDQILAKARGKQE